MTPSARPGRPEPWWLEPGGEPCETCLMVHLDELLSHCEGCDAAVCTTCLIEVRERSLRLCPACAEAFG